MMHHRRSIVASTVAQRRGSTATTITERNAATSIQSKFRGHQTRKQINSIHTPFDEVTDESEDDIHSDDNDDNHSHTNERRFVARVVDGEIKTLDPDETVEHLRNKVQTSRDRSSGYFSLFVFSAFTILFFVVLSVQRMSYIPYKLRVAIMRPMVWTSTHIADGKKNLQEYVKKSQNIYSWLDMVIEKIFEDPLCGDGICEADTEQQQLGRFGCSQDCGYYKLVENVGVHVEAMFYNEFERKEARWNICYNATDDFSRTASLLNPGNERIFCIYEEDQIFDTLEVNTTVTFRLVSDRKWFIDLHTLAGGVGFTIGSGTTKNPFANILNTSPRCEATNTRRLLNIRNLGGGGKEAGGGGKEAGSGGKEAGSGSNEGSGGNESDEGSVSDGGGAAAAVVVIMLMEVTLLLIIKPVQTAKNC